MSLPSGTVVTFYSIELLIDIVVLAVACLNLAVIGTTKLLHPNLKFILITQSVAVVFFVLVRLIYSFFFLIGTILAGAIEISVITHHPLLKRRVARIFKKIFYLRRSNRIDVAPHSVQLANNCRDGTNETTEHFKTLQQLWNE
uniref:Ion_trans domain-containing protein n=1 Tax=Globodera pallida TaxID=36090 RepID=A0A183C3G0_GLOPA